MYRKTLEAFFNCQYFNETQTKLTTNKWYATSDFFYVEKQAKTIRYLYSLSRSQWLCSRHYIVAYGTRVPYAIVSEAVVFCIE